MADVVLPQIPAGIFSNPSRGLFDAGSINAPASRFRANAENQQRVDQVLDVVRQQNEMAGPLNAAAQRNSLIEAALPQVFNLAEKRGAEPFDVVNPFLRSAGLTELPTGILQDRSNVAGVEGSEAGVGHTRAQTAAEYALAGLRNAQAASAGRESTPQPGAGLSVKTFVSGPNGETFIVDADGPAAANAIVSANPAYAESTFGLSRPSPDPAAPPPANPDGSLSFDGGTAAPSTGPVQEGVEGADTDVSRASGSAQSTLQNLTRQAELGGSRVVHKTVTPDGGIEMFVQRSDDSIVRFAIDQNGNYAPSGMSR